MRRSSPHDYASSSSRPATLSRLLSSPHEPQSNIADKQDLTVNQQQYHYSSSRPSSAVTGGRRFAAAPAAPTDATAYNTTPRPTTSVEMRRRAVAEEKQNDEDDEDEDPFSVHSNPITRQSTIITTQQSTMQKQTTSLPPLTNPPTVPNMQQPSQQPTFPPFSPLHHAYQSGVTLNNNQMLQPPSQPLAAQPPPSPSITSSSAAIAPASVQPLLPPPSPSPQPQQQLQQQQPLFTRRATQINTMPSVVIEPVRVVASPSPSPQNRSASPFPTDNLPSHPSSQMHHELDLLHQQRHARDILLIYLSLLTLLSIIILALNIYRYNYDKLVYTTFTSVALGFQIISLMCILFAVAGILCCQTIQHSRLDENLVVFSSIIHSFLFLFLSYLLYLPVLVQYLPKSDDTTLLAQIDAQSVRISSRMIVISIALFTCTLILYYLILNRIVYKVLRPDYAMSTQSAALVRAASMSPSPTLQQAGSRVVSYDEYTRLSIELQNTKSHLQSMRNEKQKMEEQHERDVQAYENALEKRLSQQEYTYTQDFRQQEDKHHQQVEHERKYYQGVIKGFQEEIVQLTIMNSNKQQAISMNATMKTPQQNTTTSPHQDQAASLLLPLLTKELHDSNEKLRSAQGRVKELEKELEGVVPIGDKKGSTTGAFGGTSAQPFLTSSFAAISDNDTSSSSVTQLKYISSLKDQIAQLTEVNKKMQTDLKHAETMIIEGGLNSMSTGALNNTTDNSCTRCEKYKETIFQLNISLSKAQSDVLDLRTKLLKYQDRYQKKQMVAEKTRKKMFALTSDLEEFEKVATIAKYKIREEEEKTR